LAISSSKVAKKKADIIEFLNAAIKPSAFWRE